MAENSKIEWTDHTFNPWIGCSKVSTGCKNCYAETLMSERFGFVNWGPGKPRKRTGLKNWNQVRKWNQEAEETGDRKKVFCASLADWLDDEIPIEWVVDLLQLIRETPHLDWLLLTKRPENWESTLVSARNSKQGFEESDLWLWIDLWMEGSRIPDNIWIGVSAENQDLADKRIPALLGIPAKVRFLSCEPLLGSVDLSAFFGDSPNITGERIEIYNAGIHWVICGGESGPRARPMSSNWAMNLKEQCIRAEVPFFFKQWGGLNPKSNGRELDGFTHSNFPFVEVRHDYEI